MFFLSFLLFSQIILVIPYRSKQPTTTTQIWSPAYTIPVHIEAKIKEELDKLLDDGTIEERDSLWCSPPIPVKKKDMLILIVVHYR